MRKTQRASCLHPHQPATLAMGAKTGRSQVRDLRRQAGKALGTQAGLSAGNKLRRALCFFCPRAILLQAVQAVQAPGEHRLGFPWLGAPSASEGLCKAGDPREARGCSLPQGEGSAGEEQLGAGETRDGTVSGQYPRLALSGSLAA